ncbi:hypothetical protein WN55_06218 [Dufourea novaeangliae]|uniref:Uncharacterized protein n=1 Tax=Dufourea novaeangliae TaxID=178035 RepID=A0A154PQ48_DUFNO|nr:hypothetical protein WN55_06218 [Dufourea novaeangliae]
MTGDMHRFEPCARDGSMLPTFINKKQYKSRKYHINFTHNERHCYNYYDFTLIY